MARFTNSTNSYVLQGILNPVDSEDAANKRYVDDLVASLSDSDTTYTFAFNNSTRTLTVTGTDGTSQTVNIPGGGAGGGTYEIQYDPVTRLVKLINTTSGDTDTATLPIFSGTSAGLVPSPDDTDIQAYNYLGADGNWHHVTGYNVKRVAFHTHWERNLSRLAWNTGDISFVTGTGGYYGGFGFSTNQAGTSLPANQIYVEFANATDATQTATDYLLVGRRIANLDGGRSYTITAVGSQQSSIGGGGFPGYQVTLDTDRQGTDFTNYNAVAYYDSEGFQPGVYIFVGTNGDSDGTVNSDWELISVEQDHFGIALNPRSVVITDPNGVQATIPAFGQSHAGVVPEPGSSHNTSGSYLGGDGNWNLLPTDVDTTYEVFDADSDGLVPRSGTNNTANHYLAGDGQWRGLPSDSDSMYAVFTQDTDGLVPHPGAANNTNQYFMGGDGNWHHLPSVALDSEHLGVFTTDSDGLVPAPGADSDEALYLLRGDGSWGQPTSRPNFGLHTYDQGMGLSPAFIDAASVLALNTSYTIDGSINFSQTLGNQPGNLVISGSDQNFNTNNISYSAPTAWNGVASLFFATEDNSNPRRSIASLAQFFGQGSVLEVRLSDSDYAIWAIEEFTSTFSIGNITAMNVNHVYDHSGNVDEYGNEIYTGLIAYSGTPNVSAGAQYQVILHGRQRARDGRTILPGTLRRRALQVSGDDTEGRILASDGNGGFQWVLDQAGSGSFRLADITDRDTSFTKDDRLLIAANDSENQYITINDFEHTLFNTTDGRYERKIPHAIAPINPAPSGAYNVPLRQDNTGTVRTNIGSSTPSWGFYSTTSFGTFPADGAQYLTTAPSEWSGYFHGTHRYLAINFGSAPSIDNFFNIYSGAVGTDPIYLVAYRNDDNWAIWKMNTGASEDTNILYLGRTPPDLVESNGTPLDTEMRWTLGLNSGGSIVNIIETPAPFTRVLTNDVDGDPTYALVDINMFDTELRDHYGLAGDVAENRGNIAELSRELHAGLYFPIDSEVIAHSDFTNIDITDTEFIMYTYPEDSEAWTAHAVNIRRNWDEANNPLLQAAFNMGFKFYDAGTGGFVQRFIYVNFGPTDSDNPVYYQESDHSFRIVIHNQGNIPGATLDDGYGNTIANAEDQTFGVGYFDQITFYSNATYDHKIYSTNDFQNVGTNTHRYFGDGTEGAVEVYISNDSEYRIRIAPIGKTSITDGDNAAPVDNLRFNDHGFRVVDAVTDGISTATITPTFRGTYAADANYSSGDITIQVVDNRPVLFRANTSITGAPSNPNTGHWDAVQGGMSFQDRTQNAVPATGHEVAHVNFANATVALGLFNGNRMATISNDFRGPYTQGADYPENTYVFHNNTLWERTGSDVTNAGNVSQDSDLDAGWTAVVTGHRDRLTPTEIITGVVGASAFITSGTTTNGTQYVRYGLINPANSTNVPDYYAIFYLEDADGNPTFFEVYPDDGQSATTYTAVPTSGRVARRTFTGTGDNITWIDGV